MLDFFDLNEFIKRIIKYIILGVVIAIACYAIPKQKMNLDQIGMIALMAAATFCLLDTYAPAIGATARAGAGLGIGLGLVGF